MLGRSFAMLGIWITMPVIPWLVYEVTGSKAKLGTVQFLGQLPLMLLVIAAGVAADRHSRRNLVFFTQFSMMIVSFAVGIMAASGYITMGVLYAYVLASGVIRALDVPSRQALIVDLVGRRNIGNALAIRTGFFNLSRVIGPAIGGYLLIRFGSKGPQTCFFAKAALFIPILLVLPTMKGLAAGALRPGARGLSGIREGLSHAWGNRSILKLLTLWAFFSVFGTWYRTLTPAFAKDIYQRDAGAYGLIISAQGVGAVTAALVLAALSRSERPQRRAVWGLCLVVVALLALAANPWYWLALPLVALYGFGMVSFTVSSDVLLQRLTTDEFRGRVMGLRTFVFGGMFAVGGLLAGTAASVPFIGTPLAVAIGGAILAAVVVVLGPGILSIETDDGEKNPAAADHVR